MKEGRKNGLRGWVEGKICFVELRRKEGEESVDVFVILFL